MRSIRQDLTVQSIKNEFMVEVYETNARIALEFQDIGQYDSIIFNDTTKISLRIYIESMEFQS